MLLTERWLYSSYEDDTIAVNLQLYWHGLGEIVFTDLLQYCDRISNTICNVMLMNES
jgi:hypothetical protein